jgi:hypothetical protein
MDKHEIEKLRRKAMTRNQIRITLLSGFALIAALIASRPVAAQDAKQPYPKMAPIEQYLMDRDAERTLRAETRRPRNVRGEENALHDDHV